MSDTGRAALEDLVERVELIAMETHELSARIEPTDSPEDCDQNNLTIKVEMQRRENQFGFRLVAELLAPQGSANATVAAIYRAEGDQPEQGAVIEFGNNVAIMSIIPYLRSALADITLRVFGRAVTIPLVRSGEIQVATE